MMHFAANHFAANHFAARHLRTAKAVPAGGGGGSAGWAHERALLEQSIELRQAKRVIQHSPIPQAKKVISKFSDYLSDEIQLNELAQEVAILRVKVANKNQRDAELLAATAELERFITDEQEAIKLLLMADEFDRMSLLSIH